MHDEILNRWAEKNYNLTDVTDVRFEDVHDSGGGCSTCGYGAGSPIEVYVSSSTSGLHIFNENYAADLINSILDVARA